MKFLNYMTLFYDSGSRDMQFFVEVSLRFYSSWEGFVYRLREGVSW
jgi:hypothetical protein